MGAEIGGARHFLLFEDAMISLRYAVHAAAGQGLVWNPGEAPVEGYSNPLWTLWMAGWQWLLKLPPRLAALPTQVSAAFLLGAAVFALGYRLRSLPAALMLALFFPATYWGLGGMESALLSLLFFGAAWALAQGRPAPAAWLTAAALLTRLDALPAALALWALGGRVHFKFALLGLALPLAAQTLWRLGYYGDWLPNTYFLKMQGLPLGFRLARGGAYLAYSALRLWPLLLLAGLGFWSRRRERGAALALGAVLAQAAASVWVGGDAFENVAQANRFLCAQAACFFYLAGLGLEALPRTWLRWPAALLAPLLAVAAPAETSLAQAARLEKPAQFAVFKDWASQGLLLRRHSRPEARLGVVTAGHLAFFSNRPCADLLGKSDRVIARGPVRPEVLEGGPLAWLPGHTKWDHLDSAGRERLDAMVQFYRPADAAERRAWEALGFRPFRLYGLELMVRNPKVFSPEPLE